MTGKTDEVEAKVGAMAAEARETAETGAERAEDLIRDVTEKASRRFEEIRSEAGHYAGKAGEAVREAADAGKGKAADLLHGIAETVRTLAGKAEGETAETAAGYARRAADGMDRLSDTLKDKSLDELGADIRAFVKERPALAIGVAAVLGFALARVLKSGGDDEREA